MSNSNEDSFEEQWRKAFEDAEADPSPVVWSEINKNLGSAKRISYRNDLLVAAMILLLFLTSLGIVMFLPKSKKMSSAPSMKSDSSSVINLQNPFENSRSDISPPSSSAASVLEKSQNLSIQNSDKVIIAKTPNPSLSNISKDDLYLNKIENKNQNPSIQFLEPKAEHEVKAISKEGLAVPTLVNQVPNSVSIELIQKNSLALKPITLFNPWENAVPQLQEQAIPQDSQQPAFWLSIALQATSFDPALQTEYTNYLSNYLQAHNAEDINSDNFFQELDEHSNALLSTGVEINLGWQVSNRISLRTGLAYSYYQRERNTNAFFIDSLNNDTRHDFLNSIQGGDLTDPSFIRLVRARQGATGNTEITLPQFNGQARIQLEETYNYLSIPLQMGYQLNTQGRFKVTVFGGIFTDILLSIRSRNKEYNINNKYTGGDQSIFKQANLSFSTSLQIERQFTSSWSAFFEPTYRQALGSWSNSPNFLRTKPNSLSFGLGLKYKF